MDESNGFRDADSCAARREVVRVAEQMVSDAWMELLLLARQEAEVAAIACLRARDRIAERLLDAQRRSDLRTLDETREEFESVVDALAVALDDQEMVQQIWSEQADAWAAWTQRRLQEAADDWREDDD